MSVGGGIRCSIRLCLFLFSGVIIQRFAISVMFQDLHEHGKRRPTGIHFRAWHAATLPARFAPGARRLMSHKHGDGFTGQDRGRAAFRQRTTRFLPAPSSLLFNKLD